MHVGGGGHVCVAGQTQAEYDVCFLPPLVLNFELPEDYPSASPPIFTLSSKWMTAAQVGASTWHADISGRRVEVFFLISFR